MRVCVGVSECVRVCVGMCACVWCVRCENVCARALTCMR